MTTVLGVFRIGDRINVRITTPFVQAGTLGTILRVYRSLANAYDIQFDRDSHHWVMQGRNLEPVAGEPPCLPSAYVLSALRRLALTHDHYAVSDPDEHRTLNPPL